MIRIHAARVRCSIATVALILAVVSLWAPRAYADDPRERPCQANVEKAVRQALSTATTVRCPVLEPEARIINGTAVATRSDTAPVTAEALLPDGRSATLEVVIDPAAKLDPAHPENAPRRVASVTYQHMDMTGSSGKGMALLFWVFALISVAGALFVISRRNLIAAVMGMVGSFLGIAALYMMLYAQFLAVIQMLVYAGAIMVLFVFVVMILNRPEDEPVSPSGRAGQVLGGLAILYLVGRLIMMLTHVEPANLEVAMNAPQPAPAQCIEWQKSELGSGALTCAQSERPDWGSIKAVGGDLFGPGIFPFEAISILLLVSVVGAIAIARPLREDSELDGSDESHADSHSPGGTV